MANQGSRLRSSGSSPSSTPPSSPPPAAHTSPVTTRLLPTDSIRPWENPTPQPELSPAQSLELRIRWLEAILYGAQRDESLAGLRERKPELRRGETLIRAAEHVQRRMNDIANTYDVLRRFIGHCEPFSSPPVKLTLCRRTACAILNSCIRALWDTPSYHTARIQGHVSNRASGPSCRARTRHSCRGQRHARN
jgi:hypothetical protein